MSYFNTTSATGETLKDYQGKSKAQNDRIFEFFKANPNNAYTPFEVHELLFTQSTPVDSIKRSLNTLTNGLFLSKTSEMRMGKYGRLNHCWRLRIMEGQLKLL